ncbi:hypothetical protein ACQJBY_072474 [Aegilops geniculata]
MVCEPAQHFVSSLAVGARPWRRDETSVSSLLYIYVTPSSSPPYPPPITRTTSPKSRRTHGARDGGIQRQRHRRRPEDGDQAARRGDRVPVPGPRHPRGAPRAAARGPRLRRHLRQHRVRARADRARPRRRPPTLRHLRRRARLLGPQGGAAGRAVRAGQRRLPARLRPLAQPRPVQGGRAARARRARRGPAPPRRRRPGLHLPRRRHLLRLAGHAGQEIRRALRVLLDRAGPHLQPLLPHGPARRARPLQLPQGPAAEGHHHVRPRRAGDRAARAHVVPAGHGRHQRGAPHHLQGLRRGPARRLRALQHRRGAGAVHRGRAARREALLRRRPHRLPSRRRRQRRRRHLHVGRVRLLPVAGRAAAGLRALHLLRQLRARHPAGAARHRRRGPRQRRQVPVGDAAGHRQLRRPGPAARGLRGRLRRPRPRRALVLPGGGARPRRAGRLPHALRLELRPRERVGRRAHALLPAPHRPVHQPAARRARVARRRAHRRPRQGVPRRGERQDPGRHIRPRGPAAPPGAQEGDGQAQGRRGARRVVAEELRRLRRRAHPPLRRRRTYIDDLKPDPIPSAACISTIQCIVSYPILGSKYY